MSLTRKQHAAEGKKIARNDREGKKISKDLEEHLDKLVGSDLKKFQEEVVYMLKSIFNLEFQTRRHANVVDVEIGKTTGDLERVFNATKEAITDLQKTVEILRTFALCNHIEVYRLQTGGRLPTEKERKTLLETLGFDPEESTKQASAEHRAKKRASAGAGEQQHQPGGRAVVRSLSEKGFDNAQKHRR